MPVSPKLSVIPSDGPREHPQPDGSIWVTSTPCHVCRRKIEQGQPITYFEGWWAHESCVTESLIKSGSPRAWLTLGAQLARHPSTFKAVEIKAIVNNLMRMAAGMVPDEYDFDAQDSVA